MMEQCAASLNSWTGECLADCPNIPVQAEAQEAAKKGKLRKLNDLIKMRSTQQFIRKLAGESAADSAAQEEDLRWCVHV